MMTEKIKTMKKIFLLFYRIAINDKFLVIEPAFGFASAESISYYTLTKIDYANDEFHLHNFETGQKRFFDLKKIIALKKAQLYLKWTLPNVPNSLRK